MWFWKHGVLLACTLVTTRLHNIDIEISMFAFTCTHHTCMNREHKTGSLNWMLHLYFTGGSFLMTLANKISWKVTDRQHSDDGYVLFIVFFFCVWFVLFIICWYLHVFKQRWTAAIIVENDHFVFEEIWRTTKIDWSMVDFRYEVCQFLGVDFETHQDDVWDASSLLFQMGPNFLEH